MHVGRLQELSVSGFAVDLDDRVPSMDDGTRIEQAVLGVLDCELRGEAIVRFASPCVSDGTRLGCVFYPDSERTAERLMALLAGLEAAGR